MIYRFLKFKLNCIIAMFQELDETLLAIPSTNWLRNNADNKYTSVSYNSVFSFDAEDVITDIPIPILKALYYNIPGAWTIFKLSNKDNFSNNNYDQ